MVLYVSLVGDTHAWSRSTDRCCDETRGRRASCRKGGKARKGQGNSTMRRPHSLRTFPLDSVELGFLLDCVDSPQRRSGAFGSLTTSFENAFSRRFRPIKATPAAEQLSSIAARCSRVLLNTWKSNRRWEGEIGRERRKRRNFPSRMET
jgi:hypothetical protein